MSYQQYYRNLLEGNRKACAEILHKAVNDNADNILDIYQQYIQKALYEVGLAWQENAISVATEHMATAVSEALMNELYQYIVTDKNTGKKIIVTSAEHELHRVGGRMICDLFELNGWQSLYIGDNTPVPDFVNMVKEQQPDVVGISLTLYFNRPFLSKMVVALQAESDLGDIPIILGGQGLKNKGVEFSRRFSNVEYLTDMADTIRFIEKFS